MEPEDTVDHDAEEHEGLLDRMRDVGVGTEDPNIVGDVGPVDVPPGKDPDGGTLIVDDPDGAGQAEV